MMDYEKIALSLMVENIESFENDIEKFKQTIE